MNILFLTENFPPETNAAATRVHERACYWVRWGHNVTVITSAPNFPLGVVFDGYRNRWHHVEFIDGIRVVRVKTLIAANRGVVLRSLDFLSFGVTGFVAALVEDRPDVIVATSPQLFTAVAGHGAGFLRRLPFVFELGDLWPASIAAVGAIRNPAALKLLEVLELYLYRRAEAIVALTAAIRHDLVIRGIPPDKLAVVRNGVDLRRYRPRARDESLARKWEIRDEFIVGYVGTHGMAHALHNVLDTAELLIDSPDIRFLFVGAGAERDRLMAEAKQRNLHNVSFREMQSKDMIPSVFSLCDIALAHLKNVPLFAGAIPSKVFEAMGMGLPILLAAPKGEASQLILDNGGVWVPAENPSLLAGAIRTLRDDPAKRAHLSASCLAAAPTHSRETRAREMLQVLEMAAAGKGRDVASRIHVSK